MIHDESLAEADDQVCGICGMDFEDHAEEFNIKLMQYNQLLQECFNSEHGES